MLILIGILLASYILGSIPTSYLLVRGLKGIDIRTVGSGNPGATNAMRVLGHPIYFVITYFIDILKGWLPVVLFAGLIPADTLRLDISHILVGSAAILGHMFTVFLRFKGGKGSATGLGVMLALAPKAILFVAVIGWMIVLLSGYVSLGSVIGAALLPAVLLVAGYPFPYCIFGIIISILVIIRHHQNIRRLLSGTESRIWGKKRAC